MDDRQGTDEGQAFFPLDSNPLIIRDGLYSRAQILARMQISKETLAEWHSEGLQFCCRGTRQYYYYGGDIIDFQRGNPGSGSTPPAPHVAPALRRKGRTRKPD